MLVMVLSFVEVLQDLIKGIFDEILSPILTDVLTMIFSTVGQYIKEIIAEIFLTLFVNLLKVVDFLEDVFDLFSGVRYVYYNGSKTYLLDLMINYDPIKKAFLVITLLAVGVAFLFTIYATTKSISDMTLDDKNPVGKILGRAMKTAVTFLMIPVMVFMLLQLSTIILQSVKTSLGGNSNTSLGTIIFLTGSLNAAKEDKYNESPSFHDTLREPYYTQQTHYYDLSDVKENFDPVKFDMVICSVCTILLILILVAAIFMFICRIFEILLLYIVSPLFVATMPLDDGALFHKWRDLFVAKMFSGFGSVIAMELFIILIPFLTSDKLVLYTSTNTILNGVNEEATINSIIKLFIIIGGAWAAYKSQHLILQILHPEAAQMAQQQSSYIVGMAVGAASGGIGMVGRGMTGAGNYAKSKLASQKQSKDAKGESEKDSKSDGNKDPNQGDKSKTVSTNPSGSAKKASNETGNKK